MTDSERIRQIFDEVADLDREERPARLEQLCAGDTALRARVEALLTHLTDGDHLGSVVRRAADELSLAGSTIGPYRLGERLGSGGMGEVYAAEQEQPVKRSVALKPVSYTHLTLPPSDLV